MDDSDISNLDIEYKRYLQILRPYLGQLLDQDVIDICNAWIQRLSICKEEEKVLRNKYIFTLCYQLAKGILEDPFLNEPSMGYLKPLPDEINSNESSTEVECLVIERENTDTKILYNNPKTNLTADNEKQCFSDVHTNSTHNITQQSESSFEEAVSKKFVSKGQTYFCYTCPEICSKINKDDKIIVNNDKYKDRVTNLVTKLRQIKNQNVLLHNELHLLKEESKICSENSQIILKVNNGTSNQISTKSSNFNMNSLKSKLQEIQDSKNMLIETVSELQKTLDFFDSMKKQEIQEIEANNKLEIIKLKTSIREEILAGKEKELEELKQKHEETTIKLVNDHIKEIENVKQVKDRIIIEKDNIIQSKDIEISQLKNRIDEIKSNQLSALNKILFDKPDISESSTSKTEELEKRLNKMERAKYKSTKAYESKLAQLQRQKHLAECSLQLQLMKQRAQVVNEIVDENQVEVTTALDKLEGKYKEIVAAIQATAVQRRMQDQIALDSIIQAICAGHDKYTNLQGTSQLESKTMHNTNKNDNQTCDMELSTLFHSNKVGSVVVGKPFCDDSIVNEYCLDSEKLGELFERVHIPQRDTGDTLSKK